MELYGDIPRLFTSIAEWLACMTCCFILKRKITNRRFAVLSVLFLVVQSLFLELTKSVGKPLWLPVMLLAFFFMGLFLWLCLDAEIRIVVFYTLGSIIMAEFAASLEWQLANSLLSFTDSMAAQGILLVVTYGVVFSVLYYAENSGREILEYFDLKSGELVGVAALTAMIFAVSNISFVSKNTPLSATIEADIFYIRTLVDLTGVILLYAYKGRICEMNAQKELNSINSVLKEQYDKYRGYQSGFDMINIKYHDLKHQIAGLRAEMTEEKREEWISRMEEELENFKPEMQTGNTVLDTLIAGKQLECRKVGIKLTCVADGALLDFIHVADLCSIFGNAMDNAIEATSFVHDEKKRLIHMSVSSQRNFVLIRFANYIEEMPEINDNFPQTTKQDKQNHGFGIKSINYTVEKYKGHAQYELKENWFELSILLPRPE